MMFPCCFAHMWDFSVVMIRNRLVAILCVHGQRTHAHSHSHGALHRYFSNREFSFTLKDDVYIRYRSYESEEEMTADIKKMNPYKIDIGAVFSAKVRSPPTPATSSCPLCISHFPLHCLLLSVLSSCLLCISHDTLIHSAPATLFLNTLHKTLCL